MSSKSPEVTKRDEFTLKHNSNDSEAASDPDAEFGGTEARKQLEKRLLLKLDARMSILIVIYVLNYVSYILWTGYRSCFEMLTPRRLTGTTRRKLNHTSGSQSPVLNPIPSAARLRGFEEDLGLVGNQFATILSILYVGYITMQVPSYASFVIRVRTLVDLRVKRDNLAICSSTASGSLPYTSPSVWPFGALYQP